MWKTNLKVMLVGLVTIGFYTFVAQIIPQLQSAVPQELDLSGDITPEVLVAAGEEVFTGVGGCTACHGLGTRAPNLRTDHASEGPIGQRCGGRVSGKDCKAYLYESLTEPGAYLVDGFAPIMTAASRQISENQIWAVIAYLQSLGGEVTVTAADIPPESGSEGAAAAGGAASPAFSASTDPRELLTQGGCFACHGIDGGPSPIGPSFDGIGANRSAEYIRQSILDPNAEIAAGYEAFGGTMPPNFGTTFSAAQLESIVQFLAGRK